MTGFLEMPGGGLGDFTFRVIISLLVLGGIAKVIEVILEQ